jgi:hypothetical protein
MSGFCFVSVNAFAVTMAEWHSAVTRRPKAVNTTGSNPVGRTKVCMDE